MYHHHHSKACILQNHTSLHKVTLTLADDILQAAELFDKSIRISPLYFSVLMPIVYYDQL